MNIISSVLQQEVQELNKTATIYGINGPVIYLKGDTGFMMSEMVYVGKEKLVGEVISLDKDITTVQVYEETSGLKPVEIVETSVSPISITLTESNARLSRSQMWAAVHLSPAASALIRLTATNYGIPTSPWPKEITFMAEIL